LHSIDNIKRLVKKLDVSYDHLFLQFQDKKTVKKINEIVKDKIRFYKAVTKFVAA